MTTDRIYYKEDGFLGIKKLICVNLVTILGKHIQVVS